MSLAYSDAPFYWPLRGSIALQNGSGTPTFTRSTAKWMFNDEGNLIKLPSGAIEMRGYRPVVNMLASTEVLATQGVTTEAKTYTISFYGTGTIAFSGAYAGSNLVGTGVSNRVQRTFTATAGTLTLTVTGSCAQAQLEDVTGQANQVASEYVSKDAIPAPYHGAGVDGVKYFATTKSGAVIPESSLIGAGLNPNSTTNNLLYCRDLTNAAGLTLPATASKWIPSVYGSGELVINGTPGVDTSGWNAYDANISIAGDKLRVQSIIDYGYAITPLSGLQVGECYLVSIDYTRVTGNASVSISPFADGSGSQNGGATATSTGKIEFIFVAQAATRYLRLQVNSPTAGEIADFSNITCKKSNIKIQVNQKGIDGRANASSLLTANANDVTILQTITAASAAACSGFFVRRVTGTGNVYFTRDGGTNWLDITSLINGSTLTQIKIENTSVLNPQIGFKIATSGDQIHVDAGINHLGTELANPILTTNAAVTVNADVLTAPTASNFSDTAGTIVATVTRDTWSSGSVVGSTTRGLYTSASNSGVQGLDGTNTVNGPAGSTLTQRKIGIKYSGTSLQAFAGNNFGSIGSYDGSFNLTNISIASGARSGIKDIAIWQSSLTDSQITEINSNIADLVSSHTISYSNIDHYIITRDLVSIPNITSNIYNCQFRLGSVNIPTSINYNNINSIIYKINTGFLITSNIVSSLVNKNIIYSIKLDAEYSVPVIQVNYLIN